MGNLFKLILFHFLLQGINAALTNTEPKNWDDVIFDSQYGDDYCFSYVRPLLNHLKRVNKQIDAHDEMKEKNDKLGKDLERIKMEFKELESKTKSQEDLLNVKDEQIKYLKDAKNEKDRLMSKLLKTKYDLLTAKDKQTRDLNDLIKVGKIIEQLNAQNKKPTGNSRDLKDYIKQLNEQNDIITENNKKEFQDLKDLINLKVKEFGEQLKTKIESESNGIQINELKNSINEKNERIGELKSQVSNNSKILEEQNQQLMKYNQQEDNLPNMGLYVDNVHRIQVPGHPAFEVTYISPLTGWTVIQRRMDGSVDFDRDWEDYKKGFGHIRGEFFLGLEKLHLMTQSKPHQLFIQMRDVNGTVRHAQYDNFKVGSEKENFKLISIGKYSGTAGDSLIHQVGIMFTTQDRKNDITEDICTRGRGGWWFSDCGFSQLNGKYQKDGIDMGENGIAWGTWKNYDYTVSLTFTQMMVRPRPSIT